MKPSGPGLLFAGRFLIIVLIFVLEMVLIRFSISSRLSFGKLYFSKDLSISSKLPIFIGIELLVVVSYDPLYFCVVCCDFSILIYNFVDLTLLHFFS